MDAVTQSEPVNRVPRLEQIRLYIIASYMTCGRGKIEPGGGRRASDGSKIFPISFKGGAGRRTTDHAYSWWLPASYKRSVRSALDRETEPDSALCPAVLPHPRPIPPCKNEPPKPHACSRLFTCCVVWPSSSSPFPPSLCTPDGTAPPHHYHSR